ncbi:MAG: NUDIX hydrolase [Candidatus Paceibacterota bacterium]
MKLTNKKQNRKNLKFAILATDVVIFSIRENILNVLLIEINIPPYYKNIYGVPGGLILPEETAEDSVYGHMKNKAGIKNIDIEQLYTFSSVDRDPRGRVVSVAYFGLTTTVETSSSAKVYWKDVKKLPKLAYDHKGIIKKALERLKAKVGYTTIIKGLLPKEFTLSDLQTAYEVVLNKKFDKRNFRKKMLSFGFLKTAGAKQTGVANRPADLYKFSVGSTQTFDIFRS